MSSTPLLSPNEPPAFDILNEESDSHVLFTCEHAASRVPERLNGLGITPDHFGKHYAVDIGARAITERLAADLKCPAIIANYSRLVIDLNRRANHPSLFPSSGEGTPIVGNMSMIESDKTIRIDTLYRPYHSWIKNWIDRKLAQGIVPAILSVHSFTPVFHGQARPWEVSALWLQDDRIPLPFIDYFRRQGYTVGDNEPYNGKILRGGTMDMHADGRRLPNLLVEYRNDLLQNPIEFEKLATHTIAALEKIFSDSSIFSLYDGAQTPYDPALEEAYIRTVMRTINDGERK